MVFLLLILFAVKHLIADKYLQSSEMSQGKRLKGIDGIVNLIDHATIHFVLTFFVVLFFGIVCGQNLLLTACGLSYLDFVLHFSIDWFKIFLEKHNVFSGKLRLIGDQVLHTFCYLGFILYLV